MAFALEQDGIFVSYEFEDEDGDRTYRRIQLVWDTDLATTLANAAAIAAAMQPVTDAAINRFTVSLLYEEGTPVSPAAGAENQEVAHLVLRLVQNPPAGMSKTKVFELPAPDAGIRVSATGPGSNLVDINDAALATFLNVFVAGEQAYLSHGQTLDEIVDGYIHHQKSKKG